MNQRTDIATTDASLMRAKSTIKRIGVANIYPFNNHFLRQSAGEMHYVDEGTGAPVLMGPRQSHLVLPLPRIHHRTFAQQPRHRPRSSWLRPVG